MPLDYDHLRTRAWEMLASYGQPVTLRHFTPAAFDPDDGRPLAHGATEFAARGVTSEFRENQVDGSLIQRGDHLLLLASQDPACRAAPGDLVSMGGETWRVEHAGRVAPGGETIMWRLQVRR
ncbi:MAG: hypothetical protein KQJ78_08720 [Deltaproteobacteria bacterium]|nr:hypothetical protein [Deltaproteobacteria bacterium]